MSDMLRRTVLALLVVTMCGGIAVAADDKAKGPAVKDAKSTKQAKDIFYRSDPPAPTQPAPMGLRYQILLRRGDYVSFVPEGYQFMGGDQFRIVFQSNTDGYAYIFNRGTSGQGHVLFPDARINAGENRIAAHSDSVVPAVGWYEFDNLPGVEELFVFFSRKQLAQLDQAASKPTVEQSVFTSVVTTMVQTRAKSVEQGKTKDIVYVEEGQTVVPAPVPPPAQPTAQPQAPSTPPATQPMPNYTPATYVGSVGEQQDNLLIHTIKLAHN